MTPIKGFIEVNRGKGRGLLLINVAQIIAVHEASSRGETILVVGAGTLDAYYTVSHTYEDIVRMITAAVS